MDEVGERIRLVRTNEKPLTYIAGTGTAEEAQELFAGMERVYS
jgi:hypothetical protein